MASAETEAAGTASRSFQLGAPAMSFEPNAGQDASSAQFIGRGPGYTVRLDAKRAVIQFQQAHEGAAKRPELTLNFGAGENRRCASAAACAKSASLFGVDTLPGTNSYFPKSDRKTWTANLPTYARVNYRDVFNGVDLQFYGKENHLEYDFVLSPGADPKPVSFTLTGAEAAHLDADGNMAATVGGEEFKLLKPIAYQPSTACSKQVAVAAEYRIEDTADGGPRVSFILGDYDHSRSLVIDPVLAYGLYIPGTGTPTSPSQTAILKMTGDAQGNTYQVAQIPGGGGAYNVLKFDPNGKLLFNVSLESADIQTTPSAIAIDAAGNVFVAGTAGTGLVTTANAFQASTVAPANTQVAFLTEIKADASTVLYSSYLGGLEQVAVSGAAADASGNVYVSGASTGTDFPATSGAYSTLSSSTNGYPFDFVAKFNPSLSGKSSLVFSSLVSDPDAVVGPTNRAGMAVDPGGEVFLATYTNSTFPITAGAYAFAGREVGESGAYVIKWNSAGSNLLYTAFLGPGSPTGIAVSGSGEAYATGSVVSADFPTTAGAYQGLYAGGFAAKLSPDGSKLDYSTFLSGPSGYIGSNVNPASIALPPGCVASCDASIAGATTTSDFPLVDPVQQLAVDPIYYVYPNILNSGFLVELNAAGSSAFVSSYLGGVASMTLSVAGLSVDSSGNVYFASNIQGPSAPVTQQASNPTGGYLAKISPLAAGVALVTPASINYPGSSTAGFANTYFAELRNVGSKPITLVRPFTFSSTDFSESDQCGDTLAGGAVCALEIFFTPAQSGPISATMTIHSDAPNQPTIVPLSGTGSDQPALAASAYILDFSNTLQGTSTASQTITVSNYGDSPQAVAPNLAGAPDYSIVNGCPAQLASKASCKITIAFAPTKIGLLSEALTIPEPGYYYYFNGTSEVAVPNGLSITLNGTGIPSASGSGSAVFSAYALNFGSSVVGAVAAVEYVTVTNQGVTPLTISAAAATTSSPQGANDFTVLQDYCQTYYCEYLALNLPLEIEPQQSASFVAQFTPSQAGPETGTIAFTDSASGTAQQVSLSGIGVYSPPALSISPANLAFPPQPVGDPSAPQTFYLSNAGNGSIVIDRAVASGDFVIVGQGGTCEGATLGTCTLPVSFAPTAVGARNGTLTLIDSLGNPQVFNLAGTGIQATGAFTVSQSSLTFPAQVQGTTSGGVQLTITNPGNSPVSINSIEATGDFSAMTSYPANCAGALAPGTDCAFDVFFTPTIANGPDSGTLSIKSTAGTQTVSLSGSALAADTALEMTPAKIIFPATKIGVTAGANNEYLIYLENTGNQPITLTSPPTITGVSPTPSGDFVLNPGNCAGFLPGQDDPTPSPLQAGESCSLTVSFTPTSTSTEKATLTLVDAGGMQTLALSGIGAAASPAILVDPYTATFSPQPVGLPNPVSFNTPYVNIYFSNGGATSIQLSSIGVTSGGSDFSVDPNTAADCTKQPVGAGGSCSLSVKFTPAAIGYRNGLLTIKDSKGNSYYSGLAGYARTAIKAIAFSPQALAFAPLAVGNSLNGQQQQLFYLNNTGDFPATIGQVTSTDITLGSGHSADFTATDSCSNQSLSPYQSCYIFVSFNPQSVGAKSGTLLVPVTYSDKTTTTLTASVSGSGLASTDFATLLPASFSFADAVVAAQGTTNYNQASNAQTFTISNNGNGPLTLGISTLTNFASSANPSGGDFGGYNYCSSMVVYSGSNCTFTVYFLPFTAGLRTGSISFPVTYGNGKTTTLTATFSGTGVAATRLLLVDPLSSQFNAEVAGTVDITNELTFTVSDVGTGPVKMTSSTITANFTVINDQCTGKTLGPVSFNYSSSPNSCTIIVASTPLATAALGVVRGTLTINDNAGAGSQQVALEGYVLSMAQLLTLSQTTASFGTVAIGSSTPSQVVYLVDRGPASNGTIQDRTQVNSIVLGGTNPSDFVETQDCGGTLGFTIAGRTVCEITVAFAPGAGATGTRSAKVTITPASGFLLVLQLVGQTTQAGSKNSADIPLRRKATMIATGSGTRAAIVRPTKAVAGGTE